MKKILLAILLCCTPAFHTGCSTAPSARVAAVQTLKAAGLSAKTALDAAAVLLREGRITVAQWQRVATFYDTRWQPTFAFAVSAARSDLDVASPQIVALAAEFAALVAQFTTPH